MIDVLLLLISIFLFGVFAVAGVGKLLDREGSERALKDFGIPAGIAPPFAILLPFGELAIAFGLLFPETASPAALGALILLLAFNGAMIWQIVHGRNPNCHCFGQLHSEPVSKKSLYRNLLFTLLPIVLLTAGRTSSDLNAVLNYDLITITAVLSLGVLLIVVVGHLKKVIAKQEDISRRIDVLEALVREGGTVERHDAGDPGDGLPIGAPFPDFELVDTAGQKVTLEKLLSEQKPVLFIFISPICEPCVAMLTEFLTWRDQLRDKVTLILVSAGTKNKIEEKFGTLFWEEIVVDTKRELAESVRAKWTPTAILVRSDGVIASHLAAGDQGITDLVETLIAKNPATENFFISNGRQKGRPPKIGEPVPSFRLPALGGGEVTTDALTGRKTLVVFWSSACPHCTRMINELEEWEQERKESDPALMVFADKNDDELSETTLTAPIVLDSGYKTSRKLGMFGTPSAVLVNEEGKIVTETAIGRDNIWALIAKRSR